MEPVLIHVTGARPNFPKAAPVIAALRGRGYRQVLVHTGQHYDDRLSDSFFRDLDLPRPDINLGVGSGPHGAQTAAVLTAVEQLLVDSPPAMVIVYGDVNSTLAATLAAVKLGIPVAHVEAGLRSFDRTMPEEINRLLTDQVADLLLCTSEDALDNLRAEGVAEERMAFVGNPMIDTLLSTIDRFDDGGLARSLGVESGYVVATMHRPSNVDTVEAATATVRVLHGVADRLPLLLPLHPRGRARLEEVGLLDHPDLHVLDPLGYPVFLGLVQHARAVITDSGGVQEETTVLGIPCLTLRPSTERPVTITHGTNRLVTQDTVLAALDEELAKGRQADHPVPPLWDGAAGPRIADAIDRWLSHR